MRITITEPWITTLAYNTVSARNLAESMEYSLHHPKFVLSGLAVVLFLMFIAYIKAKIDRGENIKYIASETQDNEQ